MKILSAQQIRESDAFTIKEENIYSHELMERAAKVFSNWFLNKLNLFDKIHIVCGTGNNGGDGLCIARHFFNTGIDVHVFITGDPLNASDDFKLNFERLKKITTDITICEGNNFDNIGHCECIIDAIFGSGLNRPVEGFIAKIIETINSSEAFVVAIDIPSGLFADSITTGNIVEADITFSFELPKLSFFFPENARWVGEWIVKPIGLSQPFINNASSWYAYLIESDIKKIVRPRTTFSHKGSYGHALLISGKPGMTGAAELCGYAALKTGAGLVTISTGDKIPEHPELMIMDQSSIKEEIIKKKFNAIGIGPGIGTGMDAYELLSSLLDEINFPVVLDADALNIISEHPALFEKIPAGSIITPHPKEFERLFGKYEKWTDLIKILIQNAKKYHIYIIYKRAYSTIAVPDGMIYFNSTGNSGMATAGSGDVLTGIITSLLAQKYEPLHAALLGTYLHGLSGDLAMLELEGQNIVAGDIIDHIQNAFHYLEIEN
ncbi:MAG: NAD(P)H-hydrate dehydratase [Chitinophagales bacterium]